MTRDADLGSRDTRNDVSPERANFRASPEYTSGPIDPTTVQAASRFLDFLNKQNPAPPQQFTPDLGPPQGGRFAPGRQSDLPQQYPTQPNPYSGFSNLPPAYQGRTREDPNRFQGDQPSDFFNPPQQQRAARGRFQQEYDQQHAPPGNGREFSAVPPQMERPSRSTERPPLPMERPPQAPRPEQFEPRQMQTPWLPGQSYELRNLGGISHGGGRPDAVVYVPPNFNPNEPIRLAVYNHGFYDSAKSAVSKTGIVSQMAEAPPNTVLIVPEWQSSPGAANYNSGRFTNQGVFQNMVQDIFRQTPGLQGKTLNDVQSVDLITHSAGHKAAEAELYNNGLYNKVQSVTLLDSLYSVDNFKKWIGDNIEDLANGHKKFYNIYSDTAGRSINQAQQVKQMLTRAGLPTNQYLWDNNNHSKPLDRDTMASHSIVFWRSNATTKGAGVHGSMPLLYIAGAENAQNYV